ncbi:adenylate cyclase [Humidesulfovibrio mexicanus]|uniref:Adenylate cyclase n=1 Tax=Humidesulfovibrio mexicanus TaxID=147047 RepID=A0A238XP16_9BACT|nr:class IV adenylate cyclase [Humidesulfovibrio mexicanus]SNR60725.1 adenylate cyclase [Humidesulfovibrio mexicanus]
MGIETELKFIDADHVALRALLAEQGATPHGAGFESNVVFDDPSGGLKAKGILLRLREFCGRHILTAKTPVNAPGPAKTCREDETEVTDAVATSAIFADLGLIPALRYEKFRESWSFMDCEVCLDTLPFGRFVEIEGGEQDILACAAALGLDLDKASRETYHELNRQWRLCTGLAPDPSFVFDEASRRELGLG